MKKSCVKIGIIVISLLVIVSGGVFIYMQSDTYKAKQLYNQLTSNYTPAECDLIISLYPETEYAQLALEKKQKYYEKVNTWKALCKNPTEQGLKHFKEDFQLTERQIVEVNKKIDSILWHKVKSELTEEAFKEYINKSPNAEHNGMAHDVVRRMNEELVDVESIKSELESTLLTFLKGYGKSDSDVYLPTLADTIDLFLFRADQPKSAINKYIKNRVNKGRNFEYEIISDLKFTKSRMLYRGVGYGINFKLKQTVIKGKKETNVYFAKVIFNKEKKIAYFKLRKDYSKFNTSKTSLKK